MALLKHEFWWLSSSAARGGAGMGPAGWGPRGDRWFAEEEETGADCLPCAGVQFHAPLSPSNTNAALSGVKSHLPSTS